jgi:hypothetical protein
MALDWEQERVKVLERYAINRCSFTFAAPNDQALLEKELKVKPEKFKTHFTLEMMSFWIFLKLTPLKILLVFSMPVH